jgi:RNA polymerase sigma-70 factor (ECF subfamily)
MTVNNDYSTRQVLTVPSPTSYQTTGTVMDTATLVRMIKSKSEKGFTILYDNYCGALYGIVMKFVRRTDVADELLQDVFLKIWKHIDGFDSAKGTFFTWMLNIARNQSIDYLRSSGYRQQLLHVNNDLFSLHMDYISAKALNTNEVEFKDIKSKALQLDPKYAEVIDMIFFYGCSHEQTALILKLPLGTVKTRARKGLGMLKTLYQQ